MKRAGGIGGRSGRWDAVTAARWLAVGLTLFVGCWFAYPPAARAQDPEEGDAVEAGRRALTESGSYPWYDAAADAVQRIDVRPPPEAATHRNSTWQGSPRPAEPLDLSAWQAFWQIVWEVLTWLFWAAIVALLVFLLFVLLRMAVLREGAGADAESAPDDEDHRSPADLVEKLPFHVRRPQADLLAEARRLYEEGRYAEAVVYLFSYQLVQLDQHQLIRLTRGKTNRQYLREIWSRTDVRRLLERTMVAFEDVFFGQHPLDRARFEACWSELDRFQHLIEEATTA